MQHINFKYKVGNVSSEFFDLICDNIVYGEIIESDIENIAQEAADDFFSNHDGWECRWPKDFIIYSEDKKLLGMCEVEQEAQPFFCASIKEAPKE